MGGYPMNTEYNMDKQVRKIKCELYHNGDNKNGESNKAVSE
jgi:hypothetical protein